MTDKINFSHFDDEGNAVMVDITGKKITLRTASASGIIKVNSEIIERIISGSIEKGDVLGVARVAGIMAVKRTSDIIPMCHPILIGKCSIDFSIDHEKSLIKAFCNVTTEGKTGVEMEALTGVTASLLTVYDMCKAVDRRMLIGDIHLETKSGGRSGDFKYQISD